MESGNGSSCDYHSIIKELANEFQRQFGCLEENKEKYKTFSVLVKKKTSQKLIKMLMKVLQVCLTKLN